MPSSNETYFIGSRSAQLFVCLTRHTMGIHLPE
jgi:hypothetical protein